MKKIFVIAIFSFFSFTLNVSAQERHTSFDDRPLCEKNHGIWREFGNACVNNCENKFDEYSMCAKSLTYGCDCGIGRCWADNRCVKNSDYKKIFDEKKEKENKELSQKRLEREERIKNDPNMRNYLMNLYAKKDNQNSANNNAAQIKNNQPNGGGIGQIIATPAPMQSDLPTPQQQQQQMITPAQASQQISNEVQNIVSTPVSPPPFYMQQNQNSGNSNQQNQLPPELPQVPIPH